MPFRPEREELVRLQEILRCAQRVHRQERRGQDEEHKPQQRRQVRHYAAHEYRAMRDVQSLEQEEAEVHQVALAPAAVARQLVDQIRRHLLVAAAEIVRDPHRPPGAAHQCSLDKIV